MLPEGLGEACWLFVTLRVLLSLVAFMASLLLKLAEPCFGGEPAPRLQATGLAFRLLGVWQRWDACWYEKIATVGYRPHDPSVNFFPLYPLLMRVVAVPLAGNLTLGGLVVAGVAYLAAMLGLQRLVGHDFGEETAQRTALYLSVFPAAFYLFAPFTEALFLALSVWALVAARRGAWGWSGLAAFLGGLTRVQGCLLTVPLAWEAGSCWRQRKGRRQRLLSLLGVAAPLCGLLLVLVVERAAAGWTALDTQRAYWGNSFDEPWSVVAASWQHIVAYGSAIESVNLALLVLFGALLAIGLRWLPRTYSLYAVPQYLLIISHQNVYSPLMAATRYLLVLFPAFVVLALLGRKRRFHHSWLAASLLFEALLLFAFLGGQFVA